MKTEVIDKFMIEMLELLKSAKDFTLEQLPEVAKEVLTYNFYSSLFGFFIGLGFAYIAFKFFKSSKDHKDEDIWDIGKQLKLILGMVFTGIALITLIDNGDNVIKIKLAPRLYLIEYVSHLVKK